MAKSNDKDVPADEMLLAEAIAAAKARGMGHALLSSFLDAHRRACDPSIAVRCCAVGAIHLAGLLTLPQTYTGAQPHHLRLVAEGNDRGEGRQWNSDGDDAGESLGWAFRCAMTDGGES